MSIIKKYQKDFKRTQDEVMTVEAYLDKAAKDSSMYANAAERMLEAIGEPEIVNTNEDPKLAKIFMNRKIKRYDAFKDFFGIEPVIERIVNFFVHSAQGLEESKQILYLVGPVGSAKSSLAERLKELMTTKPIYVLETVEGERSPIQESPLNLFTREDSEELKIPERYLKGRRSPWLTKRLDEVDGDLTKFQVRKMYPDQSRQLAIAKTEPGDENNQDISALVGKMDIRKLEFHSQDDPDAYSYSGALCKGNQGMMEFVEMFKAPIKVLHPLLTATQEGNYNPTEAIGAIPFDGMIVAHSNETEWDVFKNDKRNEAFIDRIYTIDVPYVLRYPEEAKIYKEKLLKNSSLGSSSIAPGSLKFAAQLACMTRLDVPENCNVYSKLQVYAGDEIKAKDPRAKSIQEYRLAASNKEAFQGLSTRFMFKAIARAFNYDIDETALNPIYLFYVLKSMFKEEKMSKDQIEKYEDYLDTYLIPEYHQQLSKEIQGAYLDSYSSYGQNLFDRYIQFADNWVDERDYVDEGSGEIYNKSILDDKLSEIEKPAGIANPRDFRHEVVNYVLRYRAKNTGKNPNWKLYDKLREVIEKNMFTKTEELLPIISFSNQATKDAQKKHNAFLEKMKELGYTEKQIRLLVEWYAKYRTNN